jgi:hypothetical protein
LIHTIIAGLALAGGLALVAMFAWPQSAGEQATLSFIGPLYLMIGGSVFLPQLVAGLGLLARQAWARWLMVAISIPWLLFFPFGALLGAWGLWVLLRPAAFPPPDSAKMPRLSPQHVKALVVIVATGAVMAAGLALGFWLNRDPKPSGDPVYGPDGIPLPVYQPPPPEDLGLLTYVLHPSHMPIGMVLALLLILVVLMPFAMWDRARRRARRGQLARPVRRDER